jgi:hypothetical protein
MQGKNKRTSDRAEVPLTQGSCQPLAPDNQLPVSVLAPLS